MDPADWPAPARPYFVVLVDTGSSMIACTTPPTQWPYTCNAADTEYAPNACGMVPNRINDTKCALSKTVQAFAGSANFGLVTYASQLDCGADAGACVSDCGDPDGGVCQDDNYGCVSEPFPDPNPYTGGGAWPKETCGNWPDCDTDPGPAAPNYEPGRWLNGGNIVVPLEQDPIWDETAATASNIDAISAWLDGDCSDSKELFADGWKTMPGALFSITQYLRAGWSIWSATSYCDASLTYTHPTPLGPSDPACRSVNILFVTDGELDDCGLDGPMGLEDVDDHLIAIDAAADLYENGIAIQGTTWPVRTYMLNFNGGFTSMSDAIAAAGGTESTIIVTDEGSLSQALSDIVADAVLPEVCDNADNNCNGCVDEGYAHYCNLNPNCCTDDRETCLSDYEASIASNPPDGDLSLLPCVPSDLVTSEGDWLCYNPKETCNNIDDNCDGLTDEGMLKCGDPIHCPTEEVCNGIDDDCDGQIDEDQGTGETCTNAASGQPEGICTEGVRVCVLGSWACTGPAPTDEVCDGQDNDCDGATDEDEDLFGIGELCGNDLGVCTPGTYQCECTGPNPEDCAIACIGAEEGSSETCNGLDDDCDGEIDEDQGIGAACTNSPSGTVVGECQEGYEECVQGNWTCNANVPIGEICNGRDDDCDGTTDEQLAVDCPAETLCVLGECQETCASEEMACPKGKVCVQTELPSGMAVRVCISDVCDPRFPDALACADNPYWCDAGEVPPCRCDAAQQRCVGLCNNVICPDGKVCIDKNGTCQTIDNTCWTKGCEGTDICEAGTCAPNPCDGVVCPEGQYCDATGTCVPPCLQADCPAGCYAGECVDNPCVGVACDPGWTCDPATGTCEPGGPCTGVTCYFYQVCTDGQCIQDPCWHLDCPNGFQCIDGACYEFIPEGGETDTDTSTDNDTETDGQETDPDGDTATSTDEDPTDMANVLVTGTGGCLCATSPGAGSRGPHRFALFWFIAALLAGIYLRRGVQPIRLLIAVLLAWMPACETNPYIFGPSSTDTAIDGQGTDPLDTSSGGDGSCVPWDPDDDCDGIDDDCDGVTDDGIDFSSNTFHCGQCGNDCSQRFPHAFGICKTGACVLDKCAAFFQDLNGDAVDGCEYFCKPASLLDPCNGVDLGDGTYVGVDDDCDGAIDEDVDFETSVSNCGRCGHVCAFDNAIAMCLQGQCAFETCVEGFYDIDGLPQTGCEYPCTKQSDVETCNGRDDDCDGVTDEAVAPPPISAICGVSIAADRPECASTEAGGSVLIACEAGAWTCAFPPGVCDPECASTQEICDDLDNNCDGKLNENVSNYGLPCASDDAEPDPGHGACRTTGTYICDGDMATSCTATKADCATLPGGCEEQCDGIDNDCDGRVDEPFTDKGEIPEYFVKPAVTQISETRWIFTFEASRPNATDISSGSGNGYHCLGEDCPEGVASPDLDGNEPTPSLDKSVACSVQNRIPWFNVTPVEVEQTCHALGGFICPTGDWMTTCNTVADPVCTWGYAPRGDTCRSEATYPDAGTIYCNLQPYDFDAAVLGIQNGLLATGSPALGSCGADWSDQFQNNAAHPLVYDITGNLREITKADPNAYPLMGGSFNTESDEGARCDFDFYSVSKAFQLYDTGFRCCFSEDPTL